MLSVWFITLLLEKVGLVPIDIKEEGLKNVKKNITALPGQHVPQCIQWYCKWLLRIVRQKVPRAALFLKELWWCKTSQEPAWRFWYHSGMWTRSMEGKSSANCTPRLCVYFWYYHWYFSPRDGVEKIWCSGWAWQRCSRRSENIIRSLLRRIAYYIRLSLFGVRKWKFLYLTISRQRELKF